jgi:hypothetical protein
MRLTAAYQSRRCSSWDWRDTRRRHAHDACVVSSPSEQSAASPRIDEAAERESSMSPSDHTRDAELRNLLAQTEELCARSEDLCAQSRALRAQIKEICFIRQTFRASPAFEAGSGGWRGLALHKRGQRSRAEQR